MIDGCPLPSRSPMYTASVFQRGPWYLPSIDCAGTSSRGTYALGDGVLPSDFGRNRIGVRPQYATRKPIRPSPVKSPGAQAVGAMVSSYVSGAGFRVNGVNRSPAGAV